MNMLSMTRKARCDSVLDALTTEQKKRLGRWLGEENRGYEEVRGLVAAEFGVATSRSALSRYYQRQSDKWRVMSDECADSPMGVEELAVWRELPPETTQVIEGAAVGRARQLAFSALTLREPKVAVATRMFALVRQIESAQMAREWLDLAERKAELKRRRFEAEEARRQLRAERRAKAKAPVGQVTDNTGGAIEGAAETEGVMDDAAEARVHEPMSGRMVARPGTRIEPTELGSEGDGGRATGISRLILDRAA